MPVAARARPPFVTASADAFARQGWSPLAERLDETAAGRLLADLKSERRFDDGLFLSEAEFLADPRFTGVNPRPGRNILEGREEALAYLERAPAVRAALDETLGAGWRLMDRKLVCGVPDRALPDWVRRRILGNPVNNLGAYVRPEYRDVTYFYGIDFHQDLIDWKDRDADFVTLYSYLHPVGEDDAPLVLIEGSHALGATVFPHDLERLEDGSWSYGDRNGRRARLREARLTGGAGFTAFWHACLLHGTRRVSAPKERLSLRYLFARGAGGVLDEVNAAIEGPLRLSGTRTDLDAAGAAAVKGNIIAEA